MELNLRGRSALVTGASRGIGRAIAEALAAEGCVLHLAARDPTRLQAVCDDLAQRHGVRVSASPSDLGEPGAVDALAARCPDVDILINNAGAIPRGDVVEIDGRRWREGWDLKVFGYIDMTRTYYRRMCERGGGVIVNVIGLGAEKLDYGYVAGSAGNAALVAFTRSVGSVSLDFGVRVVGVNPGWVETDRAVASLRRRAADLLGDAERWRELVTTLPAKRMIRPEEVASVVAFLASEQASAMSGHVVTVDGGFAARSYPNDAVASPTRPLP